MEKLLTSTQVCELLAVSQAKLFQMRQNKKIGFIQIGGTYRYTHADVDAVLTAGRQDAVVGADISCDEHEN